jgi:hypothetical protein
LRWVYFSLTESKESLVVVETKVVQLDVDSTPSKERFYIDIPPHYQVSLPDQRGWLNTRHVERISVDDLPRLVERCVDNAALGPWGKPGAK